jgi:hypothetical protein
LYDLQLREQEDFEVRQFADTPGEEEEAIR